MKTKPWYTRRRYWTLAILAVLVYFCLIPSPLRVSPQTTGLTTPLLPNGDVDYFGAYEQMYIHKLSPPEDNGMRLLIAACGPSILEQNAIATTVPWEEMPTHENSKYWFNNQWIPLCEHMYIDPYVKPKFLHLREWHGFMYDVWKANKKEDEPLEQTWNRIFDLHKQLIKAPWRAEDQPDTARWLEEQSPLLDLFGVAVRKPNYVCWRPRPDNGTVWMIMLPDVQSQRTFGRDLSVRVTERLGRGDIDGAWYDVMSMFYLSRKHYVHDPFLVVNFAGFSIEEMGWESAKVVLRHGNLTPEQLERFAKDLESLPRKLTLYACKSERYQIYSILQGLQKVPSEYFDYWIGDRSSSNPITDLTSFFIYLFGGEGGMSRVRYITFLPFDRNLAGKRITKLLQTERQLSDDSAWDVNSIVRKKHAEHMEQMLHAKSNALRGFQSLLRVPLIRTRSEWIADYVVATWMPALNFAHNALDRTNTRYDLLRLALALERYRLAHGDYPADLEALVPQFLEEVPIEPITGRKTFVYKVAPDAETAVLLHSSKWSEEENEWYGKGLVIRIAH